LGQVDADELAKSYSRKGSRTGLTRFFLWLWYHTYLQEALSFDSSQELPSSNSTLVKTKAPPPPCSKSTSARSQDSVFAASALITLFQPNSRIGLFNVKIPVEPNPMFCGVGNRGVEHQTDDRLAADILDADAYTGRIESNKLNRTSRGRSGPWTCGLRIGPASGQQKRQDKHGR